ncbi:MAG: glycoside hydrolase 43 family protein [Fimbriimonas sp.]|nr:glycoside hydrolase 43 family protein [Fimbriimonas sp.]
MASRIRRELDDILERSRLLLLFASILVATCTLATPSASARSETVDQVRQRSWCPDNGNGTFTNPLMWGDWPDPDVIRVGDDFFLSSTSMHYVPGCPIAKSKDLVNWTLVGYAIDRYEEDPRWDMKGGELYLNGSWATTLRYHKGHFYLGFCTPEGWGTPHGHFSMCVANSVAGPWKRTIFPEYLYDPGLFFDDDGRVYVVHGQGTLYVTELAADALSVKRPAVRIWSGGFDANGNLGIKGGSAPFGLEGSHVYKIGGRYYITCPGGGTEGFQICLRSNRITGPYEWKRICKDDRAYPPNGLHQGGMVQLKNGDWWFVIMQDRGPIGRVPMLVPIKWVDGWPMLGERGEGRGVVTSTRPNTGVAQPPVTPATSDEFKSRRLGLQWQWNHNPDPANWSLTERRGYLRLRAGVADDLTHARNTLTQRVQGPSSEATTQLDVSGLRDGDTAGLAVFEFPYAYAAVRQEMGRRSIVMVNDGKVVAILDAFTSRSIWFRASATDDGFRASFAYSLDGRRFVPIGNTLSMGLGLPWTANRFALFNFSPEPSGAGGVADFHWFHLRMPHSDGITPRSVGE